MNYKPSILQTDSIQELAEFWDTHDITDFEDELEEVSETVFDRSDETTLPLALPIQARKALRKLAADKGTTDVALAQEWVLERLKAA